MSPQRRVRLCLTVDIDARCWTCGVERTEQDTDHLGIRRVRLWAKSHAETQGHRVIVTRAENRQYDGTL